MAMEIDNQRPEREPIFVDKDGEPRLPSNMWYTRFKSCHNFLLCTPEGVACDHMNMSTEDKKEEFFFYKVCCYYEFYRCVLGDS